MGCWQKVRQKADYQMRNHDRANSAPMPDEDDLRNVPALWRGLPDNDC